MRISSRHMRLYLRKTNPRNDQLKKYVCSHCSNCEKSERANYSFNVPFMGKDHILVREER